jgi:hypothetical protein
MDLSLAVTKDSYKTLLEAKGEHKMLKIFKKILEKKPLFQPILHGYNGIFESFLEELFCVVQ